MGNNAKFTELAALAVAMVSLGGLLWSFSAAWTMTNTRIDVLERANAVVMQKVEKISEISVRMDTLTQALERMERANAENAQLTRDTHETLLKMGVMNPGGPKR